MIFCTVERCAAGRDGVLESTYSVWFQVLFIGMTTCKYNSDIQFILVNVRIRSAFIIANRQSSSRVVLHVLYDSRSCDDNCCGVTTKTVLIHCPPSETQLESANTRSLRADMVGARGQRVNRVTHDV